MFNKNSACNLNKKSSNLVELKAITPVLKEALRVANVIGKDVISTDYIKVRNNGDVHLMKILMWSKEVAIADVVFPDAQNYPIHQHPGIEIIVVYDGAIRVEIGDENYIAKKDGKPLYIPCRQEHSAYVLERTEALAITIPGDKDWLEIVNGTR